MRRLGIALLLLVGCGSNQYGYARTYAPLGDEAAFLQREQDLSYQEILRFPDRYHDQIVGWFGVVRSIEPADGGQTRLLLDLHVHMERHLCQDETDGSCRVTISDRTIGPFVALVTMHPEDRDGAHRLWTSSLVKVYGSPIAGGTEETGPILQAQYYRHWPHATYVTTGAAGNMRQ